MTAEPRATSSVAAVLEVLRAAERWLARNREAIDAVNVYPVPDGDTGTNMLLTWRATLDGTSGASTFEVAGEQLARAALFGARGNSGVILSQFVRGLTEGAAPAAATGSLDGAGLASMLERGASTAYAAVSQPVEGTMLTVMRDAASAATAAADAGGELIEVLEAAVLEADRSVERTPELLPRLREAGVVDAGGLGIAVLLRGILLGARGEPLPEAPAAPRGALDLGSIERAGHGYCTEFVIVQPSQGVGELTAALEARGADSILVVGDASALHVHAHLDDPQQALSLGSAAGEVRSVKIENMQDQHDSWAAGHEGRAQAEIGLVAVLPGDGLAIVARSIGPVEVIAGGATMNPSAGEILEAARRAASQHAFVLPNDANVLMAARQAAEAEPGFLTIVPVESVAAGIAAAFAFEAGGNLEAIAARMEEAAAGVHSIEVTLAVRDAVVDGVTIESGQALALVDGRPFVAATDLEDALLDTIEAIAWDAEVVTIYLGADAPADAAERLPSMVEARCPGLEVEVVHGGQPHYPYLAGVE